MTIHQKLLGWLLLCCLCVGIAHGAETSQMTKEEVSTLIARELVIGAPSTDIEAFFKRHDLPFTYDRIQDRYQSLIRITEFHAILIYIYVSKDKDFARAEVKNGYTGL